MDGLQHPHAAPPRISCGLAGGDVCGLDAASNMASVTTNDIKAEERRGQDDTKQPKPRLHTPLESTNCTAPSWTACACHSQCPSAVASQLACASACRHAHDRQDTHQNKGSRDRQYRDRNGICHVTTRPQSHSLLIGSRLGEEGKALPASRRIAETTLRLYT